MPNEESLLLLFGRLGVATFGLRRVSTVLGSVGRRVSRGRLRRSRLGGSLGSSGLGSSFAATATRNRKSRNRNERNQLGNRHVGIPSAETRGGLGRFSDASILGIGSEPQKIGRNSLVSNT